MKKLIHPLTELPERKPIGDGGQIQPNSLRLASIRLYDNTAFQIPLLHIQQFTYLKINTMNTT